MKRPAADGAGEQEGAVKRSRAEASDFATAGEARTKVKYEEDELFK